MQTRHPLLQHKPALLIVLAWALTFGASLSHAQYLDLAGDAVNFTNNTTVALSCFDTEMQQANAFTSNLFGNQIGVWTFADARCFVDDCCVPPAFFGDVICRGHAQAGGSVYGNGFQTQEVRIRYFMHGSGNGKDNPNGYFLTSNGNLTFSITVIVQGAPPGFPLDLYGAWRHFGGIGGIDGGDAALTTAQLIIGPWGEVLTNRFDFDSNVISGFNRQRADLPGVTVFNGDILTITLTAVGNSTTAPPNPGHPCANEDYADFIQTGEVVLRIGAQPVLSEPDSLIAGMQYLEFSLDIGSDAEKSDPQADADERFDPGDAYLSTQTPLPACGADGTRDDQFYQAFDCFPNAPDCPVPALTRAPVGSGYPIDSVRSSFGDMDGLDNLDVQLEQFQYGPGLPGIGYFISTCITRADYLYISYEDDSPNLFTDSLSPSVPVNSQPLYMPQTYATEIFGLAMWGLGTYPKSPALTWNYLTESQLHVDLAPNPGPGDESNDDDVDAIDIRDNTCSEWYFSLDHEAVGCVAGLNPGAIYRATNAGPVLIVDPQLHLGLPLGTDVQDFEFAWMDDFLPPNAFTTLALFFTVDEDDPNTLENESGFLNPAMIYWSILDGLPPFPVLNGPLENPIDGLAAWAVPLMTANINPGCLRDYDLPLAGQTIQQYGFMDFNDDCPLSPLPDHIVRVNVPYAGDWSFNLCRTQYNYDFRLTLMDNCCGGNQLAFNEDHCGALPSICVALQPGDYFLIIEGPPGVPYQLSAGPCGPSPANCTQNEPVEIVDFTHFNGGDLNGGCDLTLQGYPASFATATCGGTHCGSLFRLTDINGVTFTDTDWWSIQMAGPNRYQICTVGDADLRVTMYEFPFGPCTGNTIITDYGHYGANQQICVTDSSTGIFYLRITPADVTQLQDSVLYDYELFVECTQLPCLPAQNLVVAPITGVPNAYLLRFHAPQPGIYTVYKTTDPNQVGPPPAAGWVSVVDYTAAAAGYVDIYLTDQFDAYSVYSIIHGCQ